MGISRQQTCTFILLYLSNSLIVPVKVFMCNNTEQKGQLCKEKITVTLYVEGIIFLALAKRFLLFTVFKEVT